MHSSEAKIKNDVLIKLSEDPAVRLFNCPTGTAYAGKATRLKDGSVLIQNPRIVRFGLVTGGADLIGWKSVTVQPSDVGRKLAVFTAVETKTDIGRLSPEQKTFLNIVKSEGGLTLVARTAEGISI